jgi:hypothetical protein
MVPSPGGWEVPAGRLPMWDWTPPCGGSPQLERMPSWIRLWYRMPLVDRYAHARMWWRGGWDVAPADQGGHPRPPAGDREPRRPARRLARHKQQPRTQPSAARGHRQFPTSRKPHLRPRMLRSCGLDIPAGMAIMRYMQLPAAKGLCRAGHRRRSGRPRLSPALTAGLRSHAARLYCRPAAISPRAAVRSARSWKQRFARCQSPAGSPCSARSTGSTRNAGATRSRT